MFFDFIQTTDKRLNKIRLLTERITCSLFNVCFKLRVERDVKNHYSGRVFIQWVYFSPDSRNSELKKWHTRKWYLSDHMTDDEIIKTCYAAFELGVKHEVMEAFKVDNVILFNPHINYEVLIENSGNEVKR